MTDSKKTIDNSEPELNPEKWKAMTDEERTLVLEKLKTLSETEWTKSVEKITGKKYPINKATPDTKQMFMDMTNKTRDEFGLGDVLPTFQVLTEFAKTANLKFKFKFQYEKGPNDDNQIW